MFSSLKDLVIRPLMQADTPFLSDALYHALYTAPGEAPLSRDILLLPELSRYITGWGERLGDVGSIASVGSGYFIGAAWLRLFSHAAPGYGYIDDLTPELSVSVLPEWRGCEIGTQLIQTTLEQACPQFPAVSLSVTPGNPAQRLYERLGFEVAHATAHEITMRRAL